MTLSGTGLIAVAVMVAAGSALCYVLLLRRVRGLIAASHLKIADQIGRLDDAIRAMETRLAGHQPNTPMVLQKTPEMPLAADSKYAADESAEIAPETQAAIAAAAAATLGTNAVVRSVKAIASPWTQQGRVLVQGGHNLRVRR